MTKYLQPSFSVHVGGDGYAEGWDRVFGKREAVPTPCPPDCRMCADAKEPYEPPAARVCKSIQEQVEDFSYEIGIESPSAPCVPDADTLTLRLRLIAEEFLELLDACGVNTAHLQEEIRSDIDERTSGVDIVEVADALADIAYVVEGCAQSFGIGSTSVLAEVHASNMKKAGGPVRADGKRMKPPGWTPPDIAGVLRKQGWKDA